MQAMVQSLKELSQIKLIALAGTGVLLIAFFIFISMRVSTPSFTPMFSNLDIEEGGQIVEELERQGVPYELRANGTQILVPADEVLRLRMSLAQQGLPSSGSMVGYEIFDSSESLGTSNFVLNVNKLRALEGELSRTITAFKKIDSARVHLVIPQRELFTRDRRDPTASVALKFVGAGQLDKEEIAAIRHLVSTAVPGLEVERITIVDNRGRLLAKGMDKESSGVQAAEAEEFRMNYERRTRNTIERLLEQTVGFGKVKAEVNADIDFDRVVKNSEVFDPEGQVARSVQNIEENERENERNVQDNVTVENNLPDADDQNAAVISQSELNRSEATTNFEISKEVTNQVKETGTVNRLSVAVLVDGRYTTDENGNQVYEPRSEDELEKLEDLVRSAIGFDAQRGDEVSVVNMQFAAGSDLGFDEGPLDFLKDDLDSIIQTLVLGGVAILAILLVIRPLVNRAIESAELAREEEELELDALGLPTISSQLSDLSEEDEDMVNIDRIQGKVKSSTYHRINELIAQNPEETLGVIRQWSFGDNAY